MSKQSFLRGTLILLVAGLINRCLGFIPRITLPRVVGLEGVGLYQMGWPFLIFLITLVSGGIPIAVSKLVAEAEAANQSYRIPRILKLSLFLTMGISCVCIVTCILASSWIAEFLLREPRAAITITYMSGILLFVGFSAVLRGYFQGKLNMIPTALSQIIETIVRIAMVLLCACMFLPKGIAYAAGGAMIGVAIGESAGLIVLIYLYFRNNTKNNIIHVLPHLYNSSVARLSEFKRIAQISIPVTASKLIGASSFMFESILIAQSLAIAGVSTALATAQYGALQGMVIPILLLPSAFTSSLSISLIPSLSDAAARGDYALIRYRLGQALQMSVVTGAPFGVMMFILAKPICHYLYHSDQVALMLAWMAPIAIFLYAQAPMQAALQALNQSHIALMNTLFGSVLKLVGIYWLTSKPEFGIYGAIIAMNMSILITTCLHGLCMMRIFRLAIDFIYLGKLVICLVISSFTTYLTYSYPWTDADFIRFIAALAVNVSTYLFTLSLLNIMPTLFVSKLKKSMCIFRKR